MEKEMTSLSIPTELYNKVLEMIENTQFRSVDEYVSGLLEEKLSEGQTQQGLSQEDEEKVKERLKALGYMD